MSATIGVEDWWIDTWWGRLGSKKTHGRGCEQLGATNHVAVRLDWRRLSRRFDGDGDRCAHHQPPLYLLLLLKRETPFYLTTGSAMFSLLPRLMSYYSYCLLSSDENWQQNWVWLKYCYRQRACCPPSCYHWPLQSQIRGWSAQQGQTYRPSDQIFAFCAIFSLIFGLYLSQCLVLRKAQSDLWDFASGPVHLDQTFAFLQMVRVSWKAPASPQRDQNV